MGRDEQLCDAGEFCPEGPGPREVHGAASNPPVLLTGAPVSIQRRGKTGTAAQRQVFSRKLVDVSGAHLHPGGFTWLVLL